METKFCWQWEEMCDGATIATDPNGGLWEVYRDFNDDTGERFFTVEGPGDKDCGMFFGNIFEAQEYAEELFNENH